MPRSIYQKNFERIRFETRTKLDTELMGQSAILHWIGPHLPRRNGPPSQEEEAEEERNIGRNIKRSKDSRERQH